MRFEEYTAKYSIFTVKGFVRRCYKDFEEEYDRRTFQKKAIAVVSRWMREGTAITVAIRGNSTVWRRIPAEEKKVW